MASFAETFQNSLIQSVSLTVTSISATDVGLAFSTPDSNNPAGAGDVIYIWQTQSSIPFYGQNAATNQQNVTVTSPVGSVVFDNLLLTTDSYIVGYAVGPSVDGYLYANVVAYATVPEYNSPVKPVSLSSSMTISDIGPTSLVANYVFLPGFSPQKAGAWAGLWVGDTVSSGEAPIAWSQIMNSDSTGTVAFNNVQLGRGMTYTVGLFPTGYNSDVTKLGLTTLSYAISFG